MNQRTITKRLVATIAVLTLLPLISAFYFVRVALQTSLDLGFNPEILLVIEQEAENLKKLKSMDPVNDSVYRQQFEKLTKLRQVYAQPDLLKKRLFRSLVIYFGIGVIAFGLLALGVAIMLSRQIARSYQRLFSEWSSQQARVKYLENIAGWQDFARMLAHEIRNPLTPIEISVSALSQAYASKRGDDFSLQLNKTQQIVQEELKHLSEIVTRFGEFSRIPAVKTDSLPIKATLDEVIQQIMRLFPETSIRVAAETFPQPDPAVLVDKTLWRQVLVNIIRNGIEANPGAQPEFTISFASASLSMVKICLCNSGRPIEPQLASRIFEPYVSTKLTRKNMGLGLAIVKKIIVEHGGEISYEERRQSPCFLIDLKRA